ncbi:hypothetical protein EXIGLDRAFT_708886 [Exidia glandulosa HHB12029]|uniref:Ricin B lectin domain-containing protein n=1 Tax=Exidia glandulosa HHB12029 TaxID=1314781 RepID=A0A165J4Y5_EXIGL|nr:hypothetical protein EXIGLDRAFT_708886 [Exidia glandulosa HHB12029]
MFSSSPSFIIRAQCTLLLTISLFPLYNISPMLSFVLAALALAAHATTDCRTALVGILSAEIKNATSGSTIYKSFTLNSANQTAYVGDGNNPLVVQFEECDSFLQGEAPTGYSVYGFPLQGRLYVPATGQCIGVTDQSKDIPPYYTTLLKCGSGYSQRFGLYYNHNNGIYFTGNSDPEGCFTQGGCVNGTLGYKALSDGTPNITHTKNQITLECKNKPFHLVTTPR